MAEIFSSTLPSGLTVCCSPFKMKFLLDWMSERQSELLTALKQNIALIPEHLRTRAIMNASAGTILDGYETFIGTTLGHVFMVNAALADAKSDVRAENLDWDDQTTLWREIAGRGGLVNPQSEEEAKKWNRPFLPPEAKTNQDGGSESQPSKI